LTNAFALMYGVIPAPRSSHHLMMLMMEKFSPSSLKSLSALLVAVEVAVNSD
jgi:hypothetical protein